MNMVSYINSNTIHIEKDLCVHCPTLELANDFISKCCELDIVWVKPDIVDNNYNRYKEGTCYRINKQYMVEFFDDKEVGKHYITFAHVSYFKAKGCNVIEWKKECLLLKSND